MTQPDKAALADRLEQCPLCKWNDKLSFVAGIALQGHERDLIVAALRSADGMRDFNETERDWMVCSAVDAYRAPRNEGDERTLSDFLEEQGLRIAALRSADGMQSAPLLQVPHNSGEHLPHSDTAVGGADTQPDKAALLRLKRDYGRLHRACFGIMHIWATCPDAANLKQAMGRIERMYQTAFKAARDAIPPEQLP